MSKLGPRAREILRSGRGLNRPTDADRERVEGALRERLGAALWLAESGTASAPIRPRWQFVGSLVVGAGLVGGAAFFATRPAPVAVSAPQAVATTVPATSEVLPSPSPAEHPVFDVPKPVALVPRDRTVVSARPAEDRLAQEVALLARATSSLHAGHAADALKTLEEYQRRFPSGLLTEERRAARAQALCALGRASEAAGELARLAPQSPAAARAQQACAASSASNH